MKILILGVLLAPACSWQLPWVKPDDINRGLPSSVSIYTLNTTSSPFGTKLTGGYAKFNMNDSNLEFVVKDTNGDALGYFPKTPMEYAAQCMINIFQSKTWSMPSSMEDISTCRKTSQHPSWQKKDE